MPHRAAGTWRSNTTCPCSGCTSPRRALHPRHDRGGSSGTWSACRSRRRPMPTQHGEMAIYRAREERRAHIRDGLEEYFALLDRLGGEEALGESGGAGGGFIVRGLCWAPGALRGGSRRTTGARSPPPDPAPCTRSVWGRSARGGAHAHGRRRNEGRRHSLCDPRAPRRPWRGSLCRALRSSTISCGTMHAGRRQSPSPSSTSPRLRS